MPHVAARTISTASYPAGTLAHAALLQRMRRDDAPKCVPGPLGYETTNDDDKFPSCSTSVPEITRSCCAQGTLLTDLAAVPTNGIACIPIASLSATSAQSDLDAAWKAFEDCARKAHEDICPAGTGFDVQG
ncbi:hypothetical protein CBOM_01141 [Ceraceosorus bombacis]|uniref:Uncharacterized protein n=1 Tax=Ceraceosorus bombacis TaxID=401625 RepID=A0A0P1BAU9_9BASI|nr:hypothetical protein CBOM_01141 [Ceraceosorus bombacis]